ncbi:MAG: hypothetical protein ACYC1M_14275 [Armatimonadota bacterium]
MIRGYRNKNYPTVYDMGNRTHVVYGNSTWQAFSYGTDARYMTTGIDYAYKCDANDTLGNKGVIRITRTNGGNPLSWADSTDKFIKTFSYDNQGRLANADIPGVSRTDYGYDWVGNRTSPTAVYNDADQLTSYNGNTYSYNTDGSMYSGAGPVEPSPPISECAINLPVSVPKRHQKHRSEHEMGHFITMKTTHIMERVMRISA